MTNHLWLPPGAAHELSARASAAAAPELGPFVRANLGALTQAPGPLSGALHGWVRTQAAHQLDPRQIPLGALEGMWTHPAVYLGEQTIGGIVRRPDLYYVRHKDKRIVRETEEWLWPLLPKLLSTVVRAYAYGAVPLILDWDREDLRIEVPREEGGVRNRALAGHTHYVRSHELWPADAQLELDKRGELAALVVEGRRYTADRACVFVWDPEFGSWSGRGARRRAWGHYVGSLGVELLYAQYLERSVDSPRVVYAPPGTVVADGRDVPVTEYVGNLAQLLRGSGTIAFPSVRDANGHRRYEMETFDVPDRKDVWQQALARHDAGILKAYLVPPSLSGDLAVGDAKVLDGSLKEFVQSLAQFAAENLTRLARTVHAINHDPAKVPPPEVLCYEIPAAARKLYLEVLRLVSGVETPESAAAWVDVPALLDQLGVPLRTSPLPLEKPTPAPGRPRDLTGDREERREDARTDHGEDAVGAEDEAEDKNDSSEGATS